MLTRRNLLQAAAMAAATMLAGCSEAQDGGLDGNAAANGQTAPVEDTSAEDAPTASGSVLVAYFSATGNTEEIARTWRAVAPSVWSSDEGTVPFKLERIW